MPAGALRVLSTLSLTLCLALCPAAGGETGPAIRVALTFEPGAEGPRPQPKGFRPVRFADGQATLPFASEDGEVRLLLAGQRLYLDRNRNGEVDAADGDGAARGEHLLLPYSFAGREAEYPLLVLFLRQDYAVLGAVAALAGAVEGTELRLYDTDFDGRFGEIGTDTVALLGEDAGPIGRRPLPLGEYLALGEAIYRVGELTDGALRLAPHLGALGELQVSAGEEDARLHLQLRGETTGLVAQADSPRPVRLLPDTYTLLGGVLLYGSGQQRWGLAAEGAQAQAVSVTDGRTQLTAGKPFTVDFSAAVSLADERVFLVEDVALVDRAGLRYTPRVLTREETTVTCFARLGERATAESKMEFG